MARHWTKASSERLRVANGAAGDVEVMGPFTMVAVCFRTSNAAGQYHQIISWNTSAGGTPLAFMFYQDSCLSWSSLAVDRNSTVTVTPAEGWVLVALQKASGSAIPRFHKYAYATNTWTHEDSNGTAADVATAPVGSWEVGSGRQFNDYYDGDIAATCYISRVISDSEIEMMARGNWWRWSPRFHREFPSGRDRIGMGRQIGRDNTKDELLTGTTRSALRDPPGFAFSPLNKRR